MQNIIFNVRDIDVADETKAYIQEKLEKLEVFTKEAEIITVNVVEIKSHLNEFKDLSLEILIQLPKAFVKVEDKGHNVNAIFDTLLPVLTRRLKRYHSHKERWAKKVDWKAKALEKSSFADNYEYEEEEDELLRSYEPEIKKKTYSDDTPMHPAEAIEHMELLGHDSFLFKNIETGAYAMIYRRDKGGYGLVEPKL
jgi:putative sigma-54 modulation protein